MAADGQRAHLASSARHGFHALLSTDWSLVELHAVSNLEPSGDDHAQFERILAGLELHAPVVAANVNVIPPIQDARQIIGSWKAYRSRLRLHADGRIMIEPDRVKRSSRPISVVDDVSNLKDEPIEGQFEAKDDVLFVRWDDGSRVNYRWRLASGRLLLTDNDGQISQLQRILE